jgi:putative redox protein
MEIKSKVVWKGGMSFECIPESKHSIMMDTAIESGGEDQYARPTELILAGLGGCSGVDVISILKKRKEYITKLEINISGHKADDYPKIYTDIHIEYIVYGKNIKESSVKKAIELSQEKYCSVSLLLKKVVPITFSWKIVEE